jgi:hypothetical protein
MKKILVVISRNLKHSEFHEFWNFASDQPQRFDYGTRTLLVLNGATFSSNIMCYNTGDILTEINKMSVGNAQIGIIYHNAEIPEFHHEIFQTLTSPRLAFIKPYSTTDHYFFDEINKDCAWPLNLLRRSLYKESESTLFNKGFDEVWDYKGGNNLLEAKLELLGLLAKNRGDNATQIWIGANAIASLKPYEHDWEKYLADSDLLILTNALFGIQP